MCAFYIPWICCKGYNYLSMSIINWTKCMGGWIFCCHRSFTRRLKEIKNNLVYGNYTNVYKLGVNWDKLDFQNHKSLSQQLFLITNFSHFLFNWNMFKVWLLISNSRLLEDLIFWLNQLHVNYKWHVSQPIIIMYQTNGLKTLKFLFASCY